jgi:hypothetical protein
LADGFQSPQGYIAQPARFDMGPQAGGTFWFEAILEKCDKFRGARAVTALVAQLASSLADHFRESAFLRIGH